MRISQSFLKTQRVWLDKMSLIMTLKNYKNSTITTTTTTTPTNDRQ